MTIGCLVMLACDIGNLEKFYPLPLIPVDFLCYTFQTSLGGTATKRHPNTVFCHLPTLAAGIKDWELGDRNGYETTLLRIRN